MALRSYKYPLILSKEKQTAIDSLIRWSLATYNYLLTMSGHYVKKFETAPSKDEIKKMLNSYERSQYIGSLFHSLHMRSIINEVYDDIGKWVKNPKEKPILKTRHDTCRLNFGKDVNIQDKKIVVHPLGVLKVKWTRELPSLSRGCEIYKRGEKYYVCFLVKRTSLPKKEKVNSVVGIDMGLKEFAILSDGERIQNPRYYYQLEHRLKIEQKKLSKRQKHSANWVKQKSIVQKKYMELIHYRMNFLHQLSSRITDKYDLIGIENLNIKQMTKKKHLRKSILDASWGEFVKLLKYKAEEKGKILIEVERFYPSSQLCSKCGNRRFMPLHLRTFSCTHCGHTIDRDSNASINIENRAVDIYYGKKLIKRN